MQFAETILILFVTGNLLYFLFGKKPDKRLAYFGLVLLTLHILLGEARWQMFPTYLSLVIILPIHFFQVKARKWVRAVSSVLGILIAVASFVLCYALPVFKLPEPMGPFAVASQALYVKEESRFEDITADPDDFRELMVDVYYPVDRQDGPALPYLSSIDRLGFARKYGLPDFTFHYLDGVKTHVQAAAAPAETSFPVLIFSPGYYTPATGYLSVITELASQGFVVFCINHSYETMGSRFPDGREIFFDQEFAMNSYWSDAMGKAVDRFDAANSEEEKYAAIQNANKVFEGGAPMVARWAKDISSVIDAIEDWNEEPEFALAGRLKMDQLGVLGHSRGGAAAIEASIFDERIKAAANLDGAQWGSVIDTTLHKPTALFSSASTVDYDVNKYIFLKSRGAIFYDVVLNNSGHSNFSDIPFMIRISQLNEAGSIDPKTATVSFNAFLTVISRSDLRS